MGSLILPHPVYVRIKPVEVCSEVGDGAVWKAKRVEKIALVKFCRWLGHDVLIIGRTFVSLAVMICTQTAHADVHTRITNIDYCSGVCHPSPSLNLWLSKNCWKICLLANRGYNNPSFVVIQKEHKIFWAFLSKIRTAVRRNSVGGNVPAVSVCCRIIATTCTANVFTRESSCCFQRVLAIAILAVCLSVRLSVTRVDQAKTVQARIIKSSPSGAWKTLVSGTVKLFP